MRNFDLLTADQIECRVSQVNAKGCSLLLYKTARTDYEMLDKHIGMMGWQNKYEVIDGKMYCGIAIKDNSTGEWIWKWNCGSETDTEAEKGQASDAMKRAGFCWGIGTELYSAPYIWIPAELLMKLEQLQNGKFKVKDTFSVKEIGYDEQQNINKLVIVNQDGNTVFPRFLAKPKQPAAQPTAQPAAQPAAKQQPPVGTVSNICSECKTPVTIKVRDYSVSKYGRCLCMKCQENAGK